VRTTALARAGGLDALLATPADDYMLARNVEAAGSRLAWVPLVVEHAVADVSWQRILQRHLRWARVTRHVRLWGYCGQILTHGCVPCLLIATLLTISHHPGSVLLPVTWWLVQAMALWGQRVPIGLRVGDLPLLPFADLLAFCVFLGGLVGRPAPS
jgi:Glycosyl transferase family 21